MKKVNANFAMPENRLLYPEILVDEFVYYFSFQLFNWLHWLIASFTANLLY